MPDARCYILDIGSMKLPSISNPLQSVRRLLFASLVLMPTLVSAHPGHFHPGEEDEFDAFTSGFLHPFPGLDHLLIAIAVGWFAFSQRKPGGMKMLFAFLTSLAVAAFAGRGFQSGAGIEIAIATTLLAAGALLLVGKIPKPTAAITAISAAGFIHGFAHGSSVSPGMSFSLHITGMLTGSVLLLGLGGALSKAGRVSKRAFAPALAGSSLVAFGFFLLLQAI